MEATKAHSTWKCKVCPKCSPLVKFGAWSSLHFILLSLFPPYLRGQWSYWSYFFYRGEHFYRYVVEDWPKMPFWRIGLYGGYTVSFNMKVWSMPPPLVKFKYQFIRRGQRYWAASILNHHRGCLASKPVLYVQNATHWRSFGFNWPTWGRNFKEPLFCFIILVSSICLKLIKFLRLSAHVCLRY